MPRSMYGISMVLLLVGCASSPSSPPPSGPEPASAPTPAPAPAPAPAAAPAPAPAPVAPPPPEDRDQDGVELASVDTCPDAAEVFNGYMDEDGCPDEPPQPSVSARVALVGIHFETRSAKILPAARPVLDRIAGNLQQDPALRVEVGGHTDRSEPATLGNKRAEAVRDYLRKHGVEAARLEVRNYGAEQQVDDTAIGQARNRRIGFTVLPAS